MKFTPSRLKEILEILSGARDFPSEYSNNFCVMFCWGLWWGLLVIIICLFCGQSSRFIYIDF
jgi:hypothetical protein